MSRVRGILFDCDGVLFESRSANLAFYNAVLERFGEPPVAEEDTDRALVCHTAASPEVFTMLLGEERVEQALEAAGSLSFRQFIPEMRPQPDLVPVLEALAVDYALGVATNRGSSMAEILRHFRLDDFFRAVVTSLDVPRPKPEPDMLLLGAARLGIDPAQLLFVGDSRLDREAALKAGIRFVAYGEEVEGDWRVKSHRELPALAASLGSDR